MLYLVAAIETTVNIKQDMLEKVFMNFHKRIEFWRYVDERVLKIFIIITRSIINTIKYYFIEAS